MNTQNMSTDGKKVKSISPSRKALRTPPPPAGDEDEGLFPELPPYFAELKPLGKNDPLVLAYERDVLYERERMMTQGYVGIQRMSAESRRSPLSALPTAGGGASNHLQDCESVGGISPVWRGVRNEALQRMDTALANNDTDEALIAHVTAPAAMVISAGNLLGVNAVTTKEDGHKLLSTRVANEFLQFFPHHDILIRDGEERMQSEAICESIVQDIVTRATNLYVANCFDSMKEGYTAFTVWDEVKNAVARSFIPQDCHQLSLVAPAVPLHTRESPYFAYIGDALETRRAKSSGAKSLHLPPSHHYFGLLSAERPSTLLLGAAARLSFSGGCYARPSHHELQGAAGPAPERVPIDDYCRYVVSTYDDEAHSLAVTNSIPTTRPNTERGANKRRLGSGDASVNNSVRHQPTDDPAAAVLPHTPPSPHRTFSLPRRPPAPGRAANRHSSPSAAILSHPSAPDNGGRLSTHAAVPDDLTTALREVPTYFGLTAPTNGNSGHRPSVHGGMGVSTTSRRFSSTQPSKLGTLPRTAGRGTRSAGLLSIEGSDLVAQHDVDRDRRRPGRSTRRVNTGVPGGFAAPLGNTSELDAVAHAGAMDLVYRLPKEEAATPAVEDAAMEDTNAGNTSGRDAAGQREKELSRKAAHNKRIAQAVEQRERELTFVTIQPQTEDVKEQMKKQMEIQPEAGVVVQAAPANSSASTASAIQQRGGIVRQGRRKDDHVVLADGGVFVIPPDKHKWDEYKPKTDARSRGVSLSAKQNTSSNALKTPKSIQAASVSRAKVVGSGNAEQSVSAQLSSRQIKTTSPSIERRVPTITSKIQPHLNSNRRGSLDQQPQTGAAGRFIAAESRVRPLDARLSRLPLVVGKPDGHLPPLTSAGKSRTGGDVRKKVQQEQVRMLAAAVQASHM